MKYSLTKILTLTILICILTLPFHWIPSETIIVPKKSLSFNRTFISEDDVREIVEKYYLGSPMEKFEIQDDPLTDALKDRWEVYIDGNNTIYQHLK